MILSELERPITSQVINKVLQEQFNYEMPMEGLTPASAKALYEDLCKRIDNFRNTSKYLLGEKNAMYLSMLATAKFLTEYMREKKTLLEKEKLDYNAGIGKALGHGVNTAKNFVPHVAGSALGAFVGGLKGQALQSEHGKVKIASVDLDMKGLDSKNPQAVKSFFSKQLKKHFSEYNEAQQNNILFYMTKLYRAGIDGKSVTENNIASDLPKIRGNPFANDTDPTARKKLIDYFFKLYSKSKTAANDETSTVARGTFAHTSTPAINDTISALINLGYKKYQAVDAVNAVLEKNKSLENDFDGLFRAAQAMKNKY